MQLLGQIQSNLPELKEWCKLAKPGMKPSQSSYVVGKRLERYYGWEHSLGKEKKIWQAGVSLRIDRLGKIVYPQYNSCLVLFYEEGSWIQPHRDHPATEPTVVQVNVGCEVTLTIDGKQYQVGDGDIVSFNSKLIHSVSAAPCDRYVIGFRKIRDEWFQTALF